MLHFATAIISRVCQSESPPFRPTIPEDKVNGLYVPLMTSCWDEQPLNRPSFTGILKLLRKINGGK